jgi:site-specific DNA-adenine methylase
MDFKNMDNKDNTTLLSCCGNKKNEYKKYLKDIILNNLNKDDIFVEPFAGTAIISYNLFNSNEIKTHINDVDNYRIQFYNECKDINYIIDVNNNIKSVITKEDYIKFVNRKNINNDYKSYIYSKLISSYIPGLFDKDRKKKLININWCKFLNNTIITNNNFEEIMELYKDNEKTFIYLDPPYLSSFNSFYLSYNKAYNEENKKIDNTEIYITILNYFKICKCKILMSINNTALMSYIFKDYIKQNYDLKYSYSHKDKNGSINKNNENILIISNF